MNRRSSLSVVLPCHNEEEVISQTYSRLSALLQKWYGNLISEYEIVMVNNGSTDGTLNKMLELWHSDKRVRIVDLRNNFGYQSSITAGLFHAEKEMIVSIDADLQDDPEKIEDMVKKYYEGYEMVLGVRKSRLTDSFLKRTCSRLFYTMIKILGIKSVFNHGDFRLLSRELVENLGKMGERNRYLRGLIFKVESRYACVYYDRAPRKAGRTKFSLLKQLSLALDGITSFSSVPIRIVFFLGVAMFAVSVLGFLYVFIAKFILKSAVPGWASQIFIIVLFGGIQNLALGMIGEYVSKIYIETKQRPLYHVRKVYEEK